MELRLSWTNPLLWSIIFRWQSPKTSFTGSAQDSHSEFEKYTCSIMFLSLRDHCVNTLRPRQNGRHFADAIFMCLFLNENVWIMIKISLKFVPKGPSNNIPALVQIMAWRRPGDKPLSEPMLVSLLTHICVTRPQWVKWYSPTKIHSWETFAQISNEKNLYCWMWTEYLGNVQLQCGVH